MRCDKLIAHIPDGYTAYITDKEDMRYYSGFTGEGAVLISENFKAILTDGRYMVSAKRETDGFEVLEKLNHYEFVKENNLKLAFQPEAVSYGQYTKFKDIETTVLNVDFNELRRIKDDYEIDCLRKASEIAEKAYLEILPCIKEGVSEKEIAAKLDYIMALKGSEKPSFETICVGGKNTSMPHGIPSDYKLRSGDFVTLDFGAVYKGYHSDMTRTVVVKSVTDEMRNVYNIVLKAQTTAQETVKAGVSGKIVDLVARDIIKENGYSEYFRHSTGHGVGLKIHEYPVLSPNKDIILFENDVVSVEPGIYIDEKFGVRIENTVIVKENNCESLQKTSKELIILNN